MNERICVLSTAHEAFDVRIFYKECRSLAGAGFDVYLIAAHDKEETVDGVHIIPLDQREGRAYRFLAKGFIALWKAIRLRARVYHFHDPDLILGGILLKLLGRKVVYDVHEDVPKDILSKEWIGSLTLRKILSRLFGILLRFSILFFDRIIAATPAISKGFPAHKTITLRNVPNLILLYEAKPEKLIKTRPAVIYAGGLTKIRGIREIIEAVGKLGGLVELWLAGRWEDSEYESECRSVPGWEYVQYFGIRSLEQTYSLMKKADIGIINFLAVPNSVESLPNKAFEYLACKLPVVLSDFTYWRELFGKCAVFADPADPEDLAEKIKGLTENHEQRMKLIGEGTRLIESEYSWERESLKLIRLYRSL